MADLHEYTTKEVLNKVLLDSSGNAVAAYSHTTQEALNAVLDSANSRLNVAIVEPDVLDVVVSNASDINNSDSLNEVYSIRNPLVISSLGYINCIEDLSPGNRIL